MKHPALLVLRLSAIMVVTMLFTTQPARACSLNPVANITSPVNTDVYYKGEEVLLDGSTSVALCSGTLAYEWSVRQSNFHSWSVLPVSVCPSTIPTCNYTFQTAATGWQVRLKVTNAGRTHTRTLLNIFVVNEPESQYHITDHLGSPRVVFSRAGTVLSWTDYYPFGGILPGRSGTTSITHDNIKFTGYEKESEGGLDTYHAEARGYDPVIGRFTSRDPYYDMYPSWGPYTYALNNPLIYTDPTGEYVFTAIGAVVGGVMAAIKGEDLKGVAIGVVSGAAAGAVVDLAVVSGGTSLAAGALIGSTSSATGSAVNQLLTNGTVDLASLAIDATIGAVLGGLSGYASSGVIGYGYGRAITPRGLVTSAGESPLMKVLKGNTDVGRIQAGSLKEYKSLVRQLSKPGSQLSKTELQQFEKLTQQFGGKLRYDLNPVKGKVLKPHVQVEGLGNKVENRHIWIE